ncbi:MAG: hypothetical protein R3D59_18895 [Paracoccaceae bacterium]
MANPIAYLVLFSWPLVALDHVSEDAAGARLRLDDHRRLPFLPPATEVDLLLLPPLDKLVVANLSAFILTITVGKTKVEWLPKSWLTRLLDAELTSLSLSSS